MRMSHAYSEYADCTSVCVSRIPYGNGGVLSVGYNVLGQYDEAELQRIATEIAEGRTEDFDRLDHPVVSWSRIVMRKPRELTVPTDWLEART